MSKDACISDTFVYAVCVYVQKILLDISIDCSSFEIVEKSQGLVCKRHDYKWEREKALCTRLYHNVCTT